MQAPIPICRWIQGSMTVQIPFMYHWPLSLSLSFFSTPGSTHRISTTLIFLATCLLLPRWVPYQDQLPSFVNWYNWWSLNNLNIRQDCRLKMNRHNDVQVTVLVVTPYACVCVHSRFAFQMPPSPANTLDPSRSSRQQQHTTAEMYAPFSPTSVPSGSYHDWNIVFCWWGWFFFDVNEKPCYKMTKN